jgi:plastocyanin
MLRCPQLVLFVPLVAALLGTGLRALADENHTVVQKGRSFRPKTIEISAGDTIEFSNEDEFIHQIYVASDNLKFDSAEQPPGQKVHVTFPASGTFPVRCHIHPKMLLTVTVK